MKNNKINYLLTKIKKKQFLILKIYQQVRMENLFLIGYLKYMDLEWNINVKFEVELLTWEEEHFKNIFRSGDMHME